MFLILLLLNLISTEDLFAGCGSKVRIHLIPGQIMDFNCTTHDDCYSLICTSVRLDPYNITLIPVRCNVNCSQLNMNDDRPLGSEIDAYTDKGVYKYYSTHSISDASKALCIMTKDSKFRWAQIYLNQRGRC